jgi:hypothetical protein
LFEGSRQMPVRIGSPPQNTWPTRHILLTGSAHEPNGKDTAAPPNKLTKSRRLTLLSLQLRVQAVERQRNGMTTHIVAAHRGSECGARARRIPKVGQEVAKDFYNRLADVGVNPSPRGSISATRWSAPEAVWRQHRLES